jgi:hypothetical protein
LQKEVFSSFGYLTFRRRKYNPEQRQGGGQSKSGWNEGVSSGMRMQSD